jgi:hypothetical protein
MFGSFFLLRSKQIVDELNQMRRPAKAGFFISGFVGAVS